ncbi:MAG: hypothetical protein FWD19_04570, partial [Defluviitaleaceae bacterium]|nr:hypothetical protein [Defluviitaleaceae bacterium]
MKNYTKCGKWFRMKNDTMANAVIYTKRETNLCMKNYIEFGANFFKKFFLILFFIFVACGKNFDEQRENFSDTNENFSDASENFSDAQKNFSEETEMKIPEVVPLRIRAEKNHFVAGEKRIWINGVNTPWHNWNDFSGENFDYAWWDAHFAALRANGVNASRVWINCTNNFGRANEHGHSHVFDIDEDGMIRGVSEKHWQHLENFFEIAARHGIYIMATLISFDHFKFNEWHNSEPERWRAMIKSEAAIISFVENYTIPFVEKFRENPFLWSIDLMNEPDWVHEEHGKIEWEHLSHFFARNAAAIRERSEILVTVGLGFNKYHSDLHEGNKVSDEFLQNLYDNPYAALDFWSPHYYDWVGRHFNQPFLIG